MDNFKKPIFLYDLRDNPLTFDFGDDLLLTNFWLKKFGFQSCECIIFANKEVFVPMKYRSYNLLFSKNELWERVDNILKPLSEAANFITKTKIVSDKNELKKILQESFLVYPPYYLSFEKYNMVFNGIPYNRINNLIRDKKQFYPVANYYEPNANVIQSVRESLKITNKEKIVTFTVRDYKFEPIRNTNYKFVMDLYKFFKEKGYRFILVPDHKNLSPNIDIEIYSDATKNAEKRIALYNIAKINIGTAGGPVWLARNMPGVNMFLTNVGLKGNHIGSYSDLRRFYGREFKSGAQPFLEFDMHLIHGPEEDINKLTSNNRLKQIMRLNKLI